MTSMIEQKSFSSSCLSQLCGGASHCQDALTNTQNLAIVLAAVLCIQLDTSQLVFAFLGALFYAVLHMFSPQLPKKDKLSACHGEGSV